VYLKFGAGNERVIRGIKRISRPGLRVYRKAPKVPQTVEALGVAVVSTSQGLMTGKTARERGLGGEVLCYVW
jgi:small subunit ribosomal protein S8